LQENQNIIHKICRLYTNGDDAHKDLFQKLRFKPMDLEAKVNFRLGPIESR
jgi:hypothetical protein